MEKTDVRGKAMTSRRFGSLSGIVTKAGATVSRLVAFACPLMIITTYEHFWQIEDWLGLRSIFSLGTCLYGASLAVALSGRRKFNAITGLQILLVALVTGIPFIGDTWDPIMVFLASLCAAGIAANSLALTRFAGRPFVRFAVRAGYRITRALVAGTVCYIALVMPWAEAGGGGQGITEDFTAFASVSYSVVVGVLAFDLVVELFVRAVTHGKRRDVYV